MLDLEELVMTYTWKQIINLYEKEQINVAAEIVKTIKYIIETRKFNPYDYLSPEEIEMFFKYKEDIEKYLLLV
jgi:hypothetical protein